MIKDSLAMYFYITGTSFQWVEEKHLLFAFKVARPNVEVPIRKILAGRALERCYEKVWIASEKTLQVSNRIGCIITDSSSNTNNESIVNYMIIVDQLSQFLESVATEEQSNTAKFITDGLDRVIWLVTEKGIKIAGAVTYNTAMNKKAWIGLQRRYPKMYFQGCSSHGLHLLVKDLFAATKAKWVRTIPEYQKVIYSNICWTLFRQRHGILLLLPSARKGQVGKITACWKNASVGTACCYSFGKFHQLPETSEGKWINSPQNCLSQGFCCRNPITEAMMSTTY